MRPFHRFLTVLGIATGLPLAGAVALNLLADPHAAFPGTGIEGLDEWRANDTRRTKAERLARDGFDAIVFGSSRALVSCDPDSPHWGGARVYNAALKGTNVAEMKRVFDFALDNGRPKRVMIQVDLLGFTDRRTVADDFRESRFDPDRNATELLLRSLLGWGPTAESVEVLRAARPPARIETRANGFGEVARDKPRHWKGFTETLRSNFFVDTATYNGFRYSTERVAMVRGMLRRCRAEGIDAIVLVPPVHALQLEAERLMGIDGDAERMKRDVLEACDASSFPFWDFTGYGEPWNETVPMEGKGPMKWFRDTSHATSELGEVVLARILEGREILPGFGVRLTRAGLAAHLASIRAAREVYAAEHAAEVEGVRAVFRETAADRARNLLLAGDGR